MDEDDDDVPVAMLLQRAAEADDETGARGCEENGKTRLTDSDESEEEPPKRAKRGSGMAKPYRQQANHTQHDTQRKLEVGADTIPYATVSETQEPRLTLTPEFSLVVFQAALNRVAHTPDFKPGAYKAYKLSDDAAQLLAHFIQRPSIRAQLIPLVGDIPGKKRKGSSADKGDKSAAATPQPKKPVLISEETGRRMKVRLTAQQTRVLEEKYEEKTNWAPSECVEMLPSLNQLGPDLTVNQVSRWFDNKRRAMKKIVARIESGEDPAEPLSNRRWKRRKVEKRVRHNERELLEAAYAQNCAPDIGVRTALATAIGISEKQVTAWFMRRQQTGRPPYGVSPGGGSGLIGGLPVGGLPTPDMHGATVGLLAGHLGTHHGGAAHLLMQRGALPQREFAGMQAEIMASMTPQVVGMQMGPGIPINSMVARTGTPGLSAMWGW